MNQTRQSNILKGRCGDFARTCVRLRIWMAALCLAALYGCQRLHHNVTVLRPTDFHTALQADREAILLDVRKPEEYAEGHLEGAILLNWLDEEHFKAEAESLPKGKTVFVYCKGGVRSRAAADFLARQGHKVKNLKGGYTAWTKAELPVTGPS